MPCSRQLFLIVAAQLILVGISRSRPLDIWPNNGLPVCDSPHNQFRLVSTSDSAGGVIVVWQDDRNWYGCDIYAAHVFVQGVLDPRWPVWGAPVCVNTSGNHDYPV